MTKSLPIVGYINPLVADALRDPTSGINVTQLRAERNGAVSAPLVLKDDADAEIAKRDAEIARLYGALSGLLQEWEKLTRYGSPLAKQANPRVAAAKEALKGPEA